MDFAYDENGNLVLFSIDIMYDGRLGLYYFGARYYDPFFGLWMSPDPAGQFANPYTYGGDPLNYVDPTGMWAGGVGLVVSWDEQHGWGFGVGAAAEVGRYGINTSYMFHQDGSNTLDLGVDAKIPIQTPYIYLEINIGLGFSMNSYTGAVLSSHGGACVGEVGNCVGVDQGGSLYWDRNGGFQGATIYAEVYMQYAGEARISTGYEAGLFGAEGRGMYAGVSGYGLHAELTHLDGGADAVEANYGYRHQFDIGEYDSKNGMHFSNTAKTIGGLFALDVNQSILAMSWQLISRFTWESIQTAFGLGIGILASEMGVVEDVSYERGATILRYDPKHPIMRLFKDRAFTSGPFIAGHRDRLTRDEDDILGHEYGHTLQSRLFGPGYIVVMILSPISAAVSKEHMNMFIERDATERSKRYGF